MSQSNKIGELYSDCLKESQILRETIYELAKMNPARERTDVPTPIKIGIEIETIGQNLLIIANKLMSIGGVQNGMDK